MRILFVVEHFNAVGGIAEIVDSIAAELVRKGHTVAIVSNLDHRARQSGYERMPRPGVECRYLEIWNRKPITLRHLEALFRIPYYSRFGGLARVIREWRPEVVNSHLWAWDRYPTLMSACRGAGVPMVQSFHVTDSRGRGRLGIHGLQALRDAAELIAGSAATRDYFASLFALARQAHVIIGGVDGQAASQAEPAQRARPYVLCACRLQLEHKAVDLLIEAFHQIAHEFPDLDLLIAGGGPDADKVAQLAKEAPLGDRIALLGVKSREELRTLHRGALAFVLPSRPGECMPLVYLEALAAGTPVVGTDTGGASEVVSNARNGFLLAPGDIEGTAEAMRTLLRNPHLRRQMGSRGRKIVLDNYTWEKCATHYEQIFRGVIQSRPAARSIRAMARA